MVCWLHHGRTADWAGPVPGNWPYPTPILLISSVTLLLHYVTIMRLMQCYIPNLFEIIDIDQLSRILQIVGTPDDEFLAKITSDTVSTCTIFTTPDNYFLVPLLSSLLLLPFLSSLPPPSFPPFLPPPLLLHRHGPSSNPCPSFQRRISPSTL